MKNRMLQFWLLVVILLCQVNLFGQILYDGKDNYYQYAKTINEAVIDDQIDRSSQKKAGRIDWIYQDRLYPSGDLRAYQWELISDQQSRFLGPDPVFDQEWNPVGNSRHIVLPNNYNYGNGRISFIQFHPLISTESMPARPVVVFGCRKITVQTGPIYPICLLAEVFQI
jgi:hypothetical protein